ncbi:hypothetical protein M406DRAFT_107917 [Cryphonectria parasitica EP155]|uniref:Nephrocystin 3-like N-terminal domain-containing protein n=1 Tax=Cryphonectria parasitica (strain ATCC 38755 / EP155) TaxID=660469 RepID=A0A9P4XX51_CRYP1|nr:uncharacterized protein M406DRAFT_107917 [Cryphonectria parasitica EP155]KAF3762491.1 hypothetical protein M406DRAFT_107917 [Cryphonectria parasitica EP155]
MMDPVTAVGVAAAVVQFVDYGKRLLSRAHEIYKSPDGRTESESKLLSGLKDLRTQATQAYETLGRFPAAQSDSDIAEIFGDVEKASREFDDLLASIQQRQSRQKYDRKGKKVLKSTQLAWNSLRDESEVKTLLKRLDGIRDRGVSFTLLSLWQASKESGEREVQFSKMLSEVVETLRRLDETRASSSSGPKYLGDSAEKRDTYQDQVITVLNDHFQATDSIYRDLVETLWNPKRRPVVQPPDVEAAIMTADDSVFRTEIKDGLVSGAFDNIDAREEAIAGSYKGTFSWIFHGNTNKWSNFPKWLESDADTPYWITGKPGSGKSTLMKYILHSPALAKSLERWARGSPLYITSFYAWLPGSDLQKSLSGFMRTILFQVLQASPELVPIVAPRRWALFSTLRSCKRQPLWSDWEIEESFDMLLTEVGSEKKKRLAIFIDGLDEFKVPPERILTLISDVCRRGGIKVCVASRQWTEFNDALDRHPMLRMQDVTENDMLLFVRGKLEANRGFSDLSKIFPAEAETLIREVVEKANGVFLWSYLVVCNLEEALSNGDGLPQLRATLQSLPEDIKSLYTVIWKSIKGSKSDSAEIFSLKMAALGSLDYTVLWLAQENIAPAHALKLMIFSEDAKAGIRGIIVRRLDSKTRGLLELTPGGEVEFMHRTARDWVNKPEIWADISSYLPKDFNPSLNLLYAEALSFANDRLIIATTRGSKLLKIAMPNLLRYSPDVTSLTTPESRAGLVQALDAMDRQATLLIGRDWVDLNRYGVGVSPTFFGIVCCWCFLTYLETKLSLEPSLVNEKMGSSLSPLEHAIWGHRLVAETKKVPFELRKKTISFLLDSGASPRLSSRKHDELRDIVSGRPAFESEEERAYWAWVNMVLRVKQKKRAMASLFRWLPRRAGS